VKSGGPPRRSTPSPTRDSLPHTRPKAPLAQGVNETHTHTWCKHLHWFVGVPPRHSMVESFCRALKRRTRSFYIAYVVVFLAKIFRARLMPVSAREIAACGDEGVREMPGWASPPGHLSRTHGHWASSDFSRTRPGPPLLPNIRRPSRTNTQNRFGSGRERGLARPSTDFNFCGCSFFQWFDTEFGISLRSG